MQTPRTDRGAADAIERLIGNHLVDTAAALAGQALPAPSPWRSLGTVADAMVARLRRQRAAEHLHRLGPRPVLEALIEVGVGRDIDDVLARFGKLDGAVVRALGADRFPPAPLQRVL